MFDKSLNRRKFLKAAVFGTAATALAACAPQTVTVEVTRQVEKQVEVTKEVQTTVQVEVTKEVAVTAAPIQLKGELVFWGHQDHPIYDAGQAFMAKYPDVKFTQVAKDDWTSAIEASIAAGSGLPDLSWLEAFQVQLYARRNQLLDVTDLIQKYEKDLAPSKLAEAKYQGKYWGMPGDVTPNNLWYRQDIIEKAGIKEMNPDIKYDEFLQLAKDVKDKAGASMYIQESTVDGQGKLMYWVPLYELGGNVSDENGEKIMIGDEAGVQAVTYAKQSWDLGAGLDAPWMGPPYWGAVKDGKLAGAYSPPWMRGFFEANVGKPEEGLGKWRNQLLPAYPNAKARSNAWGGATLNSFQQTKVPDLVKAFMEYTFATTEGCTVTGNWGIIPPNLPWLKSYFKLTKQKLFDPTWDWTGQIVKALEAMRTDFYRMPAYGIADASMAKFLIPIFKGDTPVADGVKAWADYVDGENKKQMEAIK